MAEKERRWELERAVKHSWHHSIPKRGRLFQLEERWRTTFLALVFQPSSGAVGLSPHFQHWSLSCIPRKEAINQRPERSRPQHALNWWDHQSLKGADLEFLSLVMVHHIMWSI